MAGSSPSLQATVEDYHSDDSDGNNHVPVLESFRRSPAANVAAKRSHPSDLGRDKSPPVDKVVNIDVQSDSGYSTVHSAMSSAISSADSATSAKSSQSPPAIPPAAPSLPPPSPAIKRRPTITDDRKHTSQSSPRKPQRSGSLAGRKPRERRQTMERGKTEECTDPNCTECIPAPLPRGRKPSLLASAFDDGYRAPSFDQHSIRSDPAPASSYISSPQSPTYTRPAPYMQGSAVVVPAQSARRRSSSTTRAARPLSYHGGDPGNYWASSMQPPQYSNPQDHLRGPPPSMSAHFSMHPPMPPSYMAPPQQPYYTRPMQQPTHQYDPQPQRPPMPSRTSSTYNTRGYGPTVITQESTGSIPSARYASTPTGRQEPLVQTEYDTESSEYTSSEEDEEPALYNPRAVDRSRAIMPPPPPPAPVKTPVQRRPSLRHAATTQVYNSDRRMSQSQTLPARPREPDPRERSSRGGTAAPSRASSVARPALVQHPKAQSAFESTRNAKVVVENTKSQRRQSYQGYENQYDDKERRRANRNSRIYGDDEIHAPKAYVVDEDKERRRANRNSKAYMAEEEEDRRRANRSSKVYAEDEIHASKAFAAAERDRKRSSRIYAEDAIQNPKMYTQDAIVPTRRRQTDSDLRRREEQIVETKNLRAALDAEAYQRSMRGSMDPLTEKIHRAAKRASGPSHAESSHSNGSDKASRVSHRTTATNGNSGEIRLRVDASAPLSLQFNGDMDGRTVHIEPMEDGMADIVIGNPGSRPDNVYRSEKGNLLGPSKTPKAIMPPTQSRWDTEEVSVRSERPGRREGERRVLQRRRKNHD